MISIDFIVLPTCYYSFTCLLAESTGTVHASTLHQDQFLEAEGLAVLEKKWSADSIFLHHVSHISIQLLCIITYQWVNYRASCETKRRR